MSDNPIIALDAMGGDNAPAEIVAGAVRAARELGVRVALVGRGRAARDSHPHGGVPGPGRQRGRPQGAAGLREGAGDDRG